MNKSIPFITVILTMLVGLNSCNVEPKEINYGEDHCYYCDMTVVSKTHAAQYVTKKGKAHMFDAIECMVREINDRENEEELAFMLVADYQNPGVLMNAHKSTFLICPEIKSPMGANLSAFSTEGKATSVKDDLGGNTYNWIKLRERFADQ
jgi:copper chaperone NosL